MEPISFAMKLVTRVCLLYPHALNHSAITSYSICPATFKQQSHPISTMNCQSNFLIKTTKLKQQPIFLQRRSLSVHEYQAMMLLQKAEIPVPEFYVAHSPDEIRQYANELCIQFIIISISLFSEFDFVDFHLVPYLLSSKENWCSRCSTEGAGAGWWPRERLMEFWTSWWRKDCIFVLNYFYIDTSM